MGTEVKENDAGLPAALMEHMGSLNEGFEEANSGDAFATPFLQILQSGSPVVKRGNPKRIEGAEEGMIINTVTGEIFDGDEGVLLIPVYYRQGFVEWTPRDAGGGGGAGFVAEHAPGNQPATTRHPVTNRDVASNGNEIADTRYHYALQVLDDGAYEPVILAMSYTGIKKSRKWNSNIQRQKYQGRPLPMRLQMWRLVTIVETRDEYTWCNWDMRYEGPVTSESLYDAATDFYKLCAKGAVQMNHDQMSEGGASESSSGGAGAGDGEAPAF